MPKTAPYREQGNNHLLEFTYYTFIEAANLKHYFIESVSVELKVKQNSQTVVNSHLPMFMVLVLYEYDIFKTLSQNSSLLDDWDAKMG